MKKIAVIILMLLAFNMSLYVLADDANVFYSFDDTLAGSTSGMDAEIVGTEEYKKGIIENSLYISNDAYVKLPSDVMINSSDFTITAWVKPDSIANWSRVFDFGADTTKYMFLAPQNGDGQTVFAITANGAAGEQKITAPNNIKAGEWTHIAVVKKGNVGIMYIDGVEVGLNENMTITPSSLGSMDKNYIGKSQYSDPYYKGCIDDFRIYSRGLEVDEIVEMSNRIGENISMVIDSGSINVNANSDYDIPSHVEVQLYDNSTKSVKVNWDEYDKSFIKKDGVYNITGTVLGYGEKISIFVTVSSDSIKDGITAVGKTYLNGGRAVTQYSIYNESEIKKAIAIIAVYEDDILKSVGINKIDDLKEGVYTVSVDTNNSENKTVKSYLWDENQNPITNTIIKDLSNPYGSAFRLGDVQLGEGVFKTSQETGEEYLLKLDVDRLLAPVAYSVGAINDTSMYYGGWEAYNYRGYAGKGISGHTLGHWLSAAASMYAMTGDEEIKAKLDYAVGKLSEYQTDDGYVGGFEKTGFEAALSGTLKVSAFDLNGYWVPWYSIHKIYQGLIDAYELAGNKDALDVVCKFADWANNVTIGMSDEKFAQMLTCEYGGMNEVMAELYDITGKDEYYNLGIRFTQKAIIDPLANSIDELQGKHANTQIPKVIGAAALYSENDELVDYKNASTFFYDTVVNNRSYCIGGNSNYEHFGSIVEEILGTQTCETCNTYNMMKLTEHLYAWEHNAEYMDYYELALFNHILASQDPDSGMKTYFMATKQGHFKVYSTEEDSFWCCVGSGMENPMRYTKNIYYNDKNDFYVNQFITSTVEWKSMTISQSTNFPYEDTTVIKIEKGSGDSNINIRIPSWVDGGATIKINDEETINVSKAGYYTINRVWNSGDEIRVTLPMALHTYTARDSANKVAFMYGPIVLAGELGTENFPASDIVGDHTSLDNHASIDVPNIVVEDKSPETFISAENISELKFKMTAKGQEIYLKPYFDLHHERYSLYWYMYGEDEEGNPDNFVKELDDATIDTVRPNEQQPEVDHNMQKNNSYSDYFAGVSRGWRDARGEGGYFSYDMEVDNTKDNYVMALYWGSDVGFSADGVTYTRDFEILVDDTVVGEQQLNNTKPNELMYTYYKIPEDVLSGKEKVTVKFRAKGANKAAGGVFEVRITNKEVTK